LIKLKLILVNFGNLNYWYWAQFTLTLLKFDISDLQNDWHLQLLIFGIIGIGCFWFLELFIFSMSDIKHDWYRAWLTLAYLILWISGIEHYQKLGVVLHLLLIYNPLMLSYDVFVIKSQVLCLQRAYFKNKIQGLVVPRSVMTNMNYFEYQYGQASNMPKFNQEQHEICLDQKCPVSVIMSNNYSKFQMCQDYLWQVWIILIISNVKDHLCKVLIMNVSIMLWLRFSSSVVSISVM
jgi:hypothetical protein